MTTVKTFTHPDGMTQRLVVADLINGGADTFIDMAGGQIEVVYSSPPWNPGNERIWRRDANASPPTDYNHLLDAWCRVASTCAARHIFLEQSLNDRHRQLFLDAVERCPTWRLPLLEQWTVYYGSPGSRGCTNPNLLLHFGREPITTDPTGLRGQAMAHEVFRGIPDLQPGMTVGDPCMGKGQTSREAHEFELHCLGTELAAHRLDKAVAWLVKRGYVETTEGTDVTA